MRTSLALAIASISSGFAKRVLYPLKAPAALGTMWRTQRSGTAGRTNRGFLAQCPPNPQVYPSHKTTRLSRRSCVLPQPAQATAISGSPFLFLLTVEILICDSSHEFSNRNTLFLRNLFQRRFLVSKDRCSFVSSFCITYSFTRNCCTIFNCLRPAYPALSGRELDPRRIAPNQSLPPRWRWPRWPGPSGTFGAQ